MEWIAVTDRLPEKDDEYLASDGRYVGIAYFTSRPKPEWTTEYGVDYPITHWMPLPDAPTVER